MLLKVLFGAGVGVNSANTFQIDETTITCDAADESDGGDLDKLVYTDPDFKKSIRSTLGNNPRGFALLISTVCWATKFKMSESSSRDILAAVNADLQSCSAASGADQKNGADDKPNATGKNGDENNKSKNENQDKDKDQPAAGTTIAKVADVVAKDTVGDLISSLTDAAKTAIGDAKVQGKFCSRTSNSVELDAKVPVAIALKTWRVYACGPGASFACQNSSSDDPNFLEYDQISMPNLK